MLRLVPALLLALFAAGCQSTNPGVPDTQEDIPVPRGYTRAPDTEETKSYYENHEKFRNYRITYRGEGRSVQTVSDFYQHQMPVNGWDLENATPDADGVVRTLRYTKGQERATVTAKLGNTEDFILVTVEIRLK
ncbi:MAG: hypothetical protein HUU15_12010 [Candidatus Brocadiae bacterium]|nr:hypothetical protein [Candidatus Brocadiia bacterium]